MYKKANRLSREFLANSYSHKSLNERLKHNKSIDLRDNHIVINHDNGYSEIKPIDSNKRFK